MARTGGRSSLNFLLALAEGLKHRQLYLPRDLVTMANGDAGASVVPTGERDAPLLATLGGEPDDEDEGDDEDGFREVWLLRPDVSGLVSLRTLTGSSGRFDLPAGLDLDEFSVVDVSLEQFDGDPAHSGDSIVRGALEA